MKPRPIFFVLYLFIFSNSFSQHRTYSTWQERAIEQIHPFYSRLLYGHGRSKILYERGDLPILGEFYNVTVPKLIHELPAPIRDYLVDIPQLQGLAIRNNKKWDIVFSLRSDWFGFYGEFRTFGGHYTNSGTLLSPKNLTRIFNPQKYTNLVIDNYASNSGINIGIETSIGVKPSMIASGFRGLKIEFNKKNHLKIEDYISYIYGIDFTKKGGFELLLNSPSYESWIRERTPDFIERNFDIANLAKALGKRIEQSMPLYIFGIPKEKSLRAGIEIKYIHTAKRKIVTCFVNAEYTKGVQTFPRTSYFYVYGGITIK